MSKFSVSRKFFENIPERVLKYTELEYIESTGTQYIDTGIIPHIGYTAQVDFNLLNSHRTFNAILATYGGDYNMWIADSRNYTLRTYMGFTYASQSINSKNTAIGRCTMNCIWTMSLFAEHGDNGYSHMCNERIYSCVIKNNLGQTLIDMVPVKDTNNVVCMYDKVSNQFFYNQGSGNFIAGPQIKDVYQSSVFLISREFFRK